MSSRRLSSLSLGFFPHPSLSLFALRVYEGSDFMLSPSERHVSVGCWGDVSFLDRSLLIRAHLQTAGTTKNLPGLRTKKCPDWRGPWTWASINQTGQNTHDRNFISRITKDFGVSSDITLTPFSPNLCPAWSNDNFYFCSPLFVALVLTRSFVEI